MSRYAATRTSERGEALAELALRHAFGKTHAGERAGDRRDGHRDGDADVECAASREMGTEGHERGWR